jgi:hypothetical protein
MPLCAHCNSEFSTNYESKLYCSATCSSDAKKIRNNTAPMAHPLRGTLVSCPICRAKFDWAYHKKYCSYSCQREKKKRRDREVRVQQRMAAT